MDKAMSYSYAPGRSIACIRIPSFCWQVEAARRPSLRDHGPVLITGASTDLPDNPSAPARRRRSPGNPSERIVLDHSPNLDGVVSGMPLSEAVSRHKSAILVEADLPNYISVFEDLLERLEELAPDVEDAGPGTAYVGIGGLEALYGNDAQIVRVLAAAFDDFDARIGVGENKWLAYVAASISRPGSGRKVTGDPGRFLSPFPVDMLPVPYAVLQKLRSFGLRTMGDVASLSQGPLEAQFGAYGRTIWRLANSLDDRPLLPRKSVPTVSERLSFPDATVNLSTIIPGIESLLTRAFSRPVMANRYARRADLQAQVFRRPPWKLQVAFREPVGARNHALFAIKAKLDNVDIPGPLEDMRLTLSELSGEAWQQESMWKEVQQAEHLRQAVSQLRARLGVPPPIYQVRELEPQSRIPERRHALVELTP